MMHHRTRIIVVEDDDSVRDAIVVYLQQNQFEVRGVHNGHLLEQEIARDPADLIILDVMIPGEDGLSVCRRLHPQLPPVLMLSALGETMDRIVGLEVGARDYLAKPFDPRELLARVRAILRQDIPAITPDSPSYRFDGWLFQPEILSLMSPYGSQVSLTTGELRLLQAFVEHPGRVLNRDRLLELTHDDHAASFDRAIDLSVSRLRRKFSLTGYKATLIETVRGLGYRFVGTISRS